VTRKTNNVTTVSKCQQLCVIKSRMTMVFTFGFREAKCCFATRNIAHILCTIICQSCIYDLGGQSFNKFLLFPYERQN
jgi:hypothetical protein